MTSNNQKSVRNGGGGTSGAGSSPQARSVEGRLATLRGNRFVVATAKPTVRSYLVTARMLTGGAGMLPGFLIVGAQRSGTVSMDRALRQHPAVFGGILREEVHYFDLHYDRGVSWYQSHFPFRSWARWVARAAGSPPVTFETSPYYMFHPLAAERISRDLPEVKLLVLVRDPVERAYSAHAHETFFGYESEPFERALELESTRLAGAAERIVADPGYASHSHQHHAYRTRGQYAEQLERLECLFGRDRIHVVESQAFFTSPEPAYDTVLEFLGLPHVGYPNFKRRNTRPRSAPMHKHVRAALKEHYRPYDERLAKWLGHEPSWRA
ncbi:MAG: sulfotransferase family protein [Streptosporangiaceae bacterium]